MSISREPYASWLAQWMARHGAAAGSVHVMTAQGLRLVAAHRLPQPVIDAVRVVPRGRGMAGLAWERNQPVQTCNLKTDETGDVRPGAKAVNAQAAVAVPVPDAAGAVRAVVGIAFMDEREFSAEELEQLAKEAVELPDDPSITQPW